MKRIVLKTLRYLLFTLLGLVITGNLVILLTGRFYLYKGIANTYLVGEKGPTIYDLDIFPYSTLEKPKEKSIIIEHPNLNKFKIPSKYENFLHEYDTKAFLVFKGDSLLYERYMDGHDRQTVSNSFSVAKTLVALLIGIAIDEGKINSLDDKVSEYLPEFKNKGKEVITIRHLLAMASGLDWEESSKNPFSDNAESYYGWDLYGLTTNQDLVTVPGKVFKYQSGNSQLLGYILEKATGIDLSEYAEEKIWKKIGAGHDIYWSLDKELGDEKAFCCMYATARDYGRLGQLLLNQGKYKNKQIVPLSYFHEMVAPSGMATEDGIPNYRYGLHIWTYMNSDGNVNYCRGISGQYIITVPSEDLLIIRLGTKRLKNFELADDKKYDDEYVRKNFYKFGHCLGLFEYLELGKLIKENSEIK